MDVRIRATLHVWIDGSANESHLPVNKHRTATIEAILYEPVARREMLEEVLVVDIIDLDHFV